MSEATKGTENAGRRCVRRGANGIDKHIGVRIRQRRVLLSMSQSRLAAALGGLTFQQVQKYERGSNRVAAGTLLDLARALDVPVTYFYGGLGDGAAVDGPLTKRETLELARNYYAIADDRLRRAIFKMVKAAAAKRTGP